MLKRFLTVACVMAATGTAGAQSSRPLTAAQAKDHLGEQATVCGKVVTARYAQSARGQPTFLNLDAPFPNAIFTVMMWREVRLKIGEPDVAYKDKAICVTGKITSYRGDPQIIVSDPKQIALKR